jgi:hypothetical protein
VLGLQFWIFWFSTLLKPLLKRLLKNTLRTGFAFWNNIGIRQVRPAEDIIKAVVEKS